MNDIASMLHWVIVIAGVATMMAGTIGISALLLSAAAQRVCNSYRELRSSVDLREAVVEWHERHPDRSAWYKAQKGDDA